jgi:hypothetical protein
VPKARSKDKNRSGDETTVAEMVRPGGLMQVLHAFIGEFEEKQVRGDTQVSPKEVQKQLSNIMADCLYVVEGMGRGKV